MMIAFGDHVRAVGGSPVLMEVRALIVDEAAREDTEAVKQLCLYTDCVADGRWVSPDIVDEATARAFVAIASSVATPEPAAMSSAAELELWVKHMSPV